MKFNLVFLLVCYLANFKISSESRINVTTIEKFGILEKHDEYESISNVIIKMMKNSSLFKKKNGQLNVLIFSMVANQHLYFFEAFHENFNKVSIENLTFELYSFAEQPYQIATDFVILLMHDKYSRYEQIILKHFFLMFPNLFTNFFVLYFDSSNIERLKIIYDALVTVGYLNTYFIMIDSLKDYKVLRMIVNNNIQTLSPVDHEVFLDAKDIFLNFKIPYFGVVHFDTYPLNYQKNGIIYGTEGNVIQQFSKKIDVAYKIANKDTSKISIHDVFLKLQKGADICLFTSLNYELSYITYIMLNEKDGGCFLIPRNILVTHFENLYIPFDYLSLILLLISIILIIITLKVFSIVRGRKMLLVPIIFDVYQLILSLGMMSMHRISYKEKFMIISFMFMSIVLSASYQSIILSFMLSKSTLRSAHNFEELNSTSTKFYTYFRKNLNYANDIPNIRDDLIINYIDVNDFVSNTLPNNFDPNLVYLVSCKYADYFMQTSKNYRENDRIFDKLVFNEFYQRYMVRKNFYYLKEFKFMISAFKESGIYGYWQRNANPINDVKNAINDSFDKEYLYFHNMTITFYVMLTGLSIALNVFIIEIIVHHCKKCIKNRKRKDQFSIQIENRKSILRQRNALLPLKQGNKRWNKQINRIIQVGSRKN